MCWPWGSPMTSTPTSSGILSTQSSYTIVLQRVLVHFLFFDSSSSVQLHCYTVWSPVSMTPEKTYLDVTGLIFQLDVFRESTLVQKTELLFQSKAPRLGNSSNIPVLSHLFFFQGYSKSLNFARNNFYQIYFLSSAAPPPLYLKAQCQVVFGEKSWQTL